MGVNLPANCLTFASRNPMSGIGMRPKVSLSMKMRKKSELPQKQCLTCERPFAWRKKWARDWDAVKYCSHKCRAQKEAQA